MARHTVDLPQVDLMNFGVEYVRPRSGWASDEVQVDFINFRVLIHEFQEMLGREAAVF